MTSSTDHPTADAAVSDLSLSADEQRLALLGLVDFEGRWELLEAAARLVVDGETKAALIRERLAPQAGLLSASAAEVSAYELWVARHWFRTQFCRATTVAGPQAGPAQADARTARRRRRTQARTA